MEHVDKLLIGGVVVTMNQNYDVFPDGAIAVRGNAIVAVGPRQVITAAYTATETMDCSGQIIMPGLINTHTHAPMTLLRGLADDLRLDVWLMGYMMPVEREFVSPEFCYYGTLLACAEMILSGTTCFADMYYHEGDIARATVEAGLRAVLGQTVLKFPSPDAASYEESLAYTRQFIETWKGHPLITPAVAPHAPYTNTEETLRACTALAREYDVPLLTHFAETRLEVEESRREHDMAVVSWAERLGLLDAKVLAAHCVHIDPDEMRLLHNHGARVAHNPSSNLKLASGVAPVQEMLNRGLIVGIGTDGTASNNDLDMFDEMRLAAFVAKAATYDPTALPARTALAMATRMGAEALFLGDVTGSLEPGKRADVITLDHTPLHNTPRFQRDPDAIYSQIVYAAKSTDVTHVMVDGRWLMRDRQLLTIDTAALREIAADYARQIDAFLIAREGNVLSKLVAIGGLEQEESFEIQVKAHTADPRIIDAVLTSKEVQIVRHTHYRQYDTYFLFNDARQGRVRYREDDSINDRDEVISVRSRLTYTMPTKEREFARAILLSRSQFIAPADRPLRFYREYFQPDIERTIEKERRRWHILYKGILFYINLDKLKEPAHDGYFLEIKSRTWSARDAEYKAEMATEIMSLLGITPEHTIRAEYLELATGR
ncbi:MAG: amidohydrolase family protein [Anaerolineae bacterium]|nr:amidohydrolase family protein [Anaerolineae bacterium]